MFGTTHIPRSAHSILGALVLLAGSSVPGGATEPCGDFGECKALVEINSSDGDIGFHLLADGDDLISATVRDPEGEKVFTISAKGDLIEQKLTEIFFESAEPLCWDDPEAEEDELIDPLEEFVDRWEAGTYRYSGQGEQGEKSEGETVLTFALPAAPQDLDFDGSVISWTAGDDSNDGDLGNCASHGELDALVAEGLLPIHPVDVAVDAWEVVIVPDLDSGDPLGSLSFKLRVSGSSGVTAVTVSPDYLDSLPADLPLKVEVGAIGGEDNATFSEVDGFCNSMDGTCP